MLLEEVCVHGLQVVLGYSMPACIEAECCSPADGGSCQGVSNCCSSVGNVAPRILAAQGAPLHGTGYLEPSCSMTECYSLSVGDTHTAELLVSNHCDSVQCLNSQVINTRTGCRLNQTGLY